MDKKSKRDKLLDVLANEDIMGYGEKMWAELLKEAKELKVKKKRDAEAEALKKCDFRIKEDKIKVTLGAPYICDDIIEDFYCYILGHRRGFSQTFKNVNYEKYTGVWSVYKCTWYRTKYDTQHYSGLRLLEATLNGREIKLSNEPLGWEEEILAILEKQKLMIEDFENWVFQDEYRKNRILKAYNDMFDRFNLPVQETFDEIDYSILPINLYEHQRKAIKKIYDNKNVLLAYDVGAGKTYIMVDAAMELKKAGKSSKNMFVVPNNIVGQWENSFKELYPDANLLVISPNNFKPSVREQMIRTIKEGEFDGIIIAYSCFEQIKISPSYLMDSLEAEIDFLSDKKREYKETIDGVVYSIGNTAPLIRKVEGLCSTLTHYKNFVKDKKESDITFDKLGVTMLFVDEAHNYKNLSYDTSDYLDAKGFKNDGSAKCTDMLHKVRIVQKYGRGVVMATGTPLSNSIADAYTFQYYLQYDELVKSNLFIFDGWMRTFSETHSIVEISPGGKIKVERRTTNFKNLPELSTMFSQFTIFHANKIDDLPKDIKFKDIVFDGSVNFMLYMMVIKKRIGDVENSKVGRRQDNLLSICTDTRKASLDLKLVGYKQPYNESGKIYNLVQNVLKIYNEYDGCSQVVFCDYSTPKANQYNVYDEVKLRLVSSGVKEEEIAFVHDYNTEEEKLKLFDEVCKGKIRVLIGSTFKLGIGVNIQTKLKAIHHLDVPWRPADMVQREGRIIRKGNTNNEIFIFRYILKDSFDSFFWQKLEYKQTFISNFLSGAVYERSISDLANDVLTYSEVKALAISNYKIKEFLDKQNELKSAQIVLMKNKEYQQKLADDIEDNKNKLRFLYMELEKQNSNNETKLAKKTLQDIEKTKAKILELEKNIAPTDLGEEKVKALKEELSAICKKLGITDNFDI